MSSRLGLDRLLFAGGVVHTIVWYCWPVEWYTFTG